MIVILYKRKPNIFQMQMDDYISARRIKRYRSWVPREYRIMRQKFAEWLPVARRARKVHARPPGGGQQGTLDELLYPERPATLSKPAYLLRFRSIPRATFDEFAAGVISPLEWDALQAFPTFTGFFNHLIEFNDLSYFDDLQGELEAGGARFGGTFVHDVIAWELFRLQLGFSKYTDLEKLFYFTGANPLRGILYDPGFFPTGADVSRVMTQIPPGALVAFFHGLVRECLQLGVIIPRVLLWDGQFVRSNSNNNKPKGSATYTDPDAGYCRHLGVKKGVGYDHGCLYAFCGWDRVLPVHFKPFPGNRNDNPAFRATLAEFLALGIGEWRVVLADSGTYSKKSLEFCAARGLWPVLRAKRGLKNQPTRELKKGYWFNEDYIPPGWSDAEFLRLYAVRPAIEAAHSSNNTFYNAARMNTRGLANATRHRALIYILDLLRALAARKLGRPDLTSKVRAFSMEREVMHAHVLQRCAKESGYHPLQF